MGDKPLHIASGKAGLRVALGLLGCAVMWAAPAHAQDAPAKTSNPALDLNIAPGSGVLNLSDSLEGALSSITDDALGQALLDLDVSSESCRLGLGDCDVSALGYTRALNAGSVVGLDLELEPRAAVRFGEDEDSALVGAIVRIGEDLKSGELKSKSWYLFAGADAEAMTYTPGSLRPREFARGDFGIADRVIVGDAQAGIGYRLGDADISLGYYHREVTSIEDNDPGGDLSMSEDAAAISFTWRR